MGVHFKICLEWTFYLQNAVTNIEPEKLNWLDSKFIYGKILRQNLFTRIHFMSSKNFAEYKDLVRSSNICSPSSFLNLS